MAEYTVDVVLDATIRLEAESGAGALFAVGAVQGYDLSAQFDGGRMTLTEISVRSSSVHDDPHLRELLDALDAAAEGDSNDAEIQAGHDLADYVRSLCG
jgi:hypothetical protein